MQFIMVHNGIWDKGLSARECYYMERFPYQCDLCRNFLSYFMVFA